MATQPMTSEQSVSPHPRAELGRAPSRARGRAKWLRTILVLIGLVALGSGGAFLLAYGRSQDARHGGAAHHEGDSETAAGKPRVQVVHPERGGMERVTNQPGTIRAFRYAELFSKVSGFVKTLNADIGDRVKKGQLLAEIYDPERNVAVEQAQAALQHAHAEVAQARTAILAAEATVQAAKAEQVEAKSVLDQRVAVRDYRQKEDERIAELAQKRDVEERLADEEHSHFLASVGDVLAAQAGIQTAAAKVAQANAAVEKAKADLMTAQAAVKISEANLDMAKVFVEYTKIISPYDGVVTKRGEAVHPGTFIQTASEGNNTPLFTVAADHTMRTIVLVPDRDVPYVKPGQPATVTLDALAGQVFKAKVSRLAESEDLKDRTMRVEIDLDNADHALRDGMFGRAEILLEKLIKNVSIPSSCLVQRNGRGEGAVLVVKNGELHRVPIHVGLDNGLRVEVTSGLELEDEVVLRPDASVPDGTKVQSEQVAKPKAVASPASEA